MASTRNYRTFSELLRDLVNDVEQLKTRVSRPFGSGWSTITVNGRPTLRNRRTGETWTLNATGWERTD